MALTNALLGIPQLAQIIECLLASPFQADKDLGKELEETWASDPEVEYFQERAEEYARDGEIEFDQPAPVSTGGDRGAYVAAWVWVEDDRPDPDEDDEEIETPEDNGDTA